MAEKMKNTLWYVLVFLLPWQTVWILHESFVGGEKWQYATVGLYVSDVALFAFSLFFFRNVSREVWRVIWRDSVVWLLLFLVLWSGVSMVWAIEPSLSLLSAWRILLMMLVYMAARYGRVSIRKTLLVFLVSLALSAGMGLSQWVMQSVSASTLLGIAGHEAWQPGTSVLKTESGRFLRVYGGFEHPNVFGSALAFAIVSGIWLFAQVKRMRMRLILLILLLVFSFSLVLTFSRSAWFGLFLGAGVLVVGELIRRNVLEELASFWGKFKKSDSWIPESSSTLRQTRSRMTKWGGWTFEMMAQKNAVLVAVFFSVAAFGVAFVCLQQVSESRFSGEMLAREGSATERVVYMRQAFEAIREHLIVGVGGGNFTAFSMKHFSDLGSFVGAFQPVHMVPLLVFAELGAVGFLCCTGMILIVIFRAWRQWNILGIALFFVLLPALFLDHFLWTGHFGGMLLGLFLGIASRDRNRKSESNRLIRSGEQ